MMILRSSPASPFVRKVRIAAAILGLESEITHRECRYIEPGRHHSSAESARQDSVAADRGRQRALRLAGDHGLPRSSRRRRPDRAEGSGCAHRGAAAAGAGRRHPGCVDPHGLRGAAGGRPKSTRRNGSIIRPARSRVPWRRSKQNPRRSIHRRMSDRSRSPARSAIATSALAMPGARTIRGSSPGSTISPRACRRSPRPSRQREVARLSPRKNAKPRTVRSGASPRSGRPGDQNRTLIPPRRRLA